VKLRVSDTLGACPCAEMFVVAVVVGMFSFSFLFLLILLMMMMMMIGLVFL